MSANNSSLPGPVVLFKEAWNLFLARIWLFLPVLGINIALVIAVLLIALLVGGGVFFVSGARMTEVLGLVLAVLGIAAFFVLLYLSYWMQVCYILLLGEEENTKEVKNLVKKAKPLIWPLFLTSLLVGLSIVGGYMLFIIPGLILVLWYSQTQYVVVHENKKGLLAMHTSREYIRGRFFPLVGRMVAPLIPFFLLSMLPAFLPDQLAPLFSNLFQALSLLGGPLYLCYGFVLYQHLAKTTTSARTVPVKERKVYLAIPLVGYSLLVLILIYGLAIGF